MYMMSWNEDDARIEASLGGRVTAAEVKVLAEELREVGESMADRPYLLVLDYSRAKAFDEDAVLELNLIKDFCLDNGADKIVSVVWDDDEASKYIDQRLQLVLEGREAIVAQGDEAVHLEQATAVFEIDEYRQAA